MDWNVESISNLKGKVIIVTGGNSGLGFEAAKVFSKKQATVILACRSMDKALEAKEQIVNENHDAIVDLMLLDLSSLDSIRMFASNFTNKYKQLDVLLNNAGIMTVPYGLTEDGFELQNGVNHLGHFVLTALLFDVIKNTPGSRIVNVSSNAHKFGKMDFDDYLFEKGKYGKLKSYGRSKLSNLLFTYELDRRIKEKKLDILVLAAHPGVAATNLGRYMKMTGIAGPLFKMFFKYAQSAYQGALPEIRACVDPLAKSGDYYGPGGTKKKPLPPRVERSSQASYNQEDAQKLWVLSEKLTKTRFEL
ncbi:MAG: SDR family NAD(P)-dependent oxidoreductase [Firmicutes bacterium]|nr:SDR family NAD(P)-dependent oxidoreductase [Bacillota bacterium]